MDKNLQQFPREDMFNPWKPWAIGAFLFFVLALIGRWLMWENVPSWYGSVLLVAGVICATTFFGAMLDNDWIKVPKTQVKERGYWHVAICDFSDAVPGNWSHQDQKELIYLFDGMPIEITYFDEVGTEQTRRFRVQFNYDGGPLYARYLVFYKWYLAIPKTKEAVEYVVKPTVPFFSIEPINAPAS